MRSCPFCNLADPQQLPPPTPQTVLFRRVWRGTHWLVPSLLLAFMPKCPMCIVACVALFTSVGISVNTAHWIQLLLWAFCGVSFGYLAISRFPLFQRSRNVPRPIHAR